MEGMEMAEAGERVLAALQLDTPPVALSFVDKPPPGVPGPAREVPSSCTFWREAEQGVFYAKAEEHFNCAVGAMVMGFELPAALQEELGGLVQSMAQQDYLAPEEAAQIPTVPKRSAGILYGPLADFPIPPDLVLLWLTPRQAMLVDEAVGAANWTDTPMTVTGRPACGALPRALQSGKAAMTFGCMGMRTFTEVAADRMLAAIPGKEMLALAHTLERTLTANEAMRAFYEGRRSALTASEG
jgi:uncharacterized protein (DUF169 family)